MTFEQIEAIFAKTAVMVQETDRIVQDTAQQMKETDRKMQETDRKIDRLAEQISDVSKQIGGIDNNIGYHAEQFFQNAFLENKVFGGIKYDEAIPNMRYGNDVEFDMVLENCNSVAIIEIKNRIHPGFVKKMAKERFSEFRKYFPEYKDCDVYLGIAGFSFSDKVLSEAQKYGIGIIRQVGEGIEVKAERLKAYR